MPTISKKSLRRLLAQRYIHDMPSFAPRSAHTWYLSSNPFPATLEVYDSFFADTSYTGQNLYLNAWFYLEGDVNSSGLFPTMYQYAIASFNCGSGAFISTALPQSSYATLGIWELHTRVAPLDKDNAIDEIVQRMRVREDVAMWTVDGNLFYPVDGAASPFVLEDILDVRLFADPAGTQDHNICSVGDWDLVMTATGREFRLAQPLAGSQQLIFDAILIPTLPDELSTINTPDVRWILAGAAAKCYDLMIQDAPAQQVAILERRRSEASQEYSRLATRFQPNYSRPVKMHDVVRTTGNSDWDWDLS